MTRSLAEKRSHLLAQDRCRVLVIDDDRQEFTLLEAQLAVSGGRFELEWAGTYAEGMKALATGAYDACLVDYRLGGMKTGLDVLRSAKESGLRTPIILLTGLGDDGLDLAVMQGGGADYLVKGQFGPELLERSLRYCIAQARAAEAIALSEERYRTIVEDTQAVLFQLSARGCFTYVTDSVKKILGVEPKELIGKHVLRLVHHDELKTALQLAAPGQPSAHCELRLAGPNGRQGVFSVTVRRDSAGFSGLAIEITDRKRLEAQLAQAEKMSAMGMLTAGIAHELATPLTVIGGSVDRLVETGENAAPSLLIKQATDRAMRLVRQILDYGHKEDGPAEPFDLKQAASAALALVQPMAKLRQMEVRMRAEGEPLTVRGWSTQIEQVVINLTNNALDASPAGGGVEIVLDRTERENRAWARLRVIDKGSGIPADVLSRIAEPFTTSKAPGKGTGLGLSLVNETVKRHGGALSFESALGEGTTVSLLLPL